MAHKHVWTAEQSGNKENPGCFDIGGGRMRFNEECACGSTRKTTVVYAKRAGEKSLDIVEVTTKGTTRRREVYR